MRTLLTFTGFHDPFAETGIAGEMETGPILTVLSERQFDAVALFSTPTMAQGTAATAKAIVERHPKVSVEVFEFSLSDPTNYPVLLRQMRANVARVQKKWPDGDYVISVSSGTPHMHAAWLLLAAGGEIAATLVQSKASKFVGPGQKRVSEIDFTHSSFPQIKPFPVLPENAEQRSDVFAVAGALGFIGDHETHLAAIFKATALSQYDEHVLLLGETGTGKEMMARLIHHSSRRASAIFVCVNCAGFTEHLIESQLFGHKRGAFTGADRDHAGVFETASGGTLFLDEIGELPISSQAKLLRVLEHGTLQRLGDSREQKINVRVVAATNVDVRRAIREKQFRKDLYYRFGEVIELAPLRERKSDIPKLALHFLDEWNARYSKRRRLGTDAIKRMLLHSWPGNIRELRKLVERAARLTNDKVIHEKDLLFDEMLSASGFEALPEPHNGFEINVYCAEVRRRLVERAMAASGGNKSGAARLLGVTPQAVHLFLKGQKL